MRYAVIDIGANTIRLQVCEVAGEKLTTIFSKKIVAGLVTYIDADCLTDKGCQKLISVLQTHLASARLFNVADIFVFATASLRSVSNLAEIKNAVKKSTQIDLQVLPQEMEARLGYEGIRLSCNAPEGFTVDIGGASTEVMQFKDNVASPFVNLEFGSLSLYKNYVGLVLPTASEVKRMDRFVKKNISIKKSVHAKNIFGIGGTIRAIGNILSEFIQGNSNVQFSYKDVLLLYERLISYDKKLFKIILQVSPERVHTITPGTVIVKNLLEKFSGNGISVCNTGLREGVLLHNLKCTTQEMQDR